MAEGKTIRLSVMGVQYPPSEEAAQMFAEERERLAVVTEMRVAAEYYAKGDSHYFFYEEQPEGFHEPVKTRVKCRRGFLEVVRQGSLGSRMVFEPGKIHRTEYPTPYGKLILDVAAERVTLETVGKSCPQVTVYYTLSNEGQQMGVYQLKIGELPDER